MSVGYAAIQWSKPKRRYDLIVGLAIIAYIGTFMLVSKMLWTGASAISDEVLILRALGSCGFILLHIILCIGPLARFDPRWLPVLFNRRHLGVMTFFIALAHGVIAIGYYHGFGTINPLVSLLTSNTEFASVQAFPYQLLGVVALIVLFLLAATSHDFWNKNLSAATWKRLHMSVYGAYVLLVAHVALGALQNDRGLLGPIATVLGVCTVGVLHLLAAWRERNRDLSSPTSSVAGEEWIDVGTPAEIPDDRARTVCAPGGERIAIFKHNGRISAVTNVCAHQGGPLGEGAIIDGCITCPWHGWQYKPQDGCAPPPFQEKVATYRVRISAGRVQVNARALPPGTPTDPVSARSEAANV
ncbi:MAG: ferric reductase-like transmembrane domain-containing protein [Phycisphaerales bacterium]|nr:ferric reductase-like transmembrane domain-containing protein [Phycisphaerales bacterium]